MDLAAGIVRSAQTDAPAKGVCWAHETLPAVFETVTEQIADPPAKGATGPASYRIVTHQKVVSDRSEVWFRTPCPDQTDADFVTTLQRALKARGYYRGALTGRFDAATGAAVRRLQSASGLNSARLSLAAAKELGIVATGLDELEVKDEDHGTQGAASAADQG